MTGSYEWEKLSKDYPPIKTWAFFAVFFMIVFMVKAAPKVHIRGLRVFNNTVYVIKNMLYCLFFTRRRKILRLISRFVSKLLNSSTVSSHSVQGGGAKKKRNEFVDDEMEFVDDETDKKRLLYVIAAELSNWVYEENNKLGT